MDNSLEILRMKAAQPAVMLALTVASLFYYQCGIAQQIGIDTDEIEPLVKKWNYAHNARSFETFQEVYDRSVVFYAQKLSKSRCIAQKRKLFQEHRDFKQDIISDIRYTAFTSGVIKCDFQKEV